MLQIKKQLNGGFKMNELYNELLNLRNRLSNDGNGQIFEEDHLTIDRVLDIFENKSLSDEQINEIRFNLNNWGHEDLYNYLIDCLPHFESILTSLIDLSYIAIDSENEEIETVYENLKISILNMIDYRILKHLFLKLYNQYK